MNTKIAVLIPVYNNLEGLICSLSTITSSFKVTVVIVDDGSKDVIDLGAIAHCTQHSIKLITLVKNSGIVSALNAGLHFIYENDFTHIARLDAGDLMLNDRLDTQLEFLLENPACILVGGAGQFVDESGALLFEFSPPTSHNLIKKNMHLNSCFCHPAVTWKLNGIRFFYDEEYKYAEDYELFWRIMKSYSVANLSTVVVETFADPAGISRTRRREQLLLRIRIQLENFDFFTIFSYVGLLKSYLLFYLPVNLIDKIKSLRR